MAVTLRKYPYPYKSALSICSDIDNTAFDEFIETQKFIISHDDTKLGRGLGLPMGNSFWMFDTPGIAESAFSYFENLSGKPSQYARPMRELINAGILDVLHSYGNFATIGEFSRDLAKRALEELALCKLPVRVWTNHGGIESIQNIGSRSMGAGDISQEKNVHHTDLLQQSGCIFYWDAESSLMTNVGQDINASFGDAYWNSPLYSGMQNWLKYTTKGLITLADFVYFKLRKRHFIYWNPFNPNENSLVELDKLRDGTNFYRFRRFGHGLHDNSDDLSMLLNNQVLERLVNSNGSLVLYIHLGDRHNSTIDKNMPLSKESIATLRTLANYYNSGKIWITTTSRLLMYSLLHKSIQFDVEENPRSVFIRIHKFDIPIDTFQPSPQELSGFTFLVPADKEINLIYQDRPVPYTRNPIDHYGRSSITVPINTIEWPL